MRYYFTTEEGETTCFNITNIERKNHLIQFTIIDEEKKHTSLAKLRKIADKIYVSVDDSVWKKVSNANLHSKLSYVNNLYTVNRGYLPSSLNQATEGQLITKMPGKVVKVCVREGEKINEGDTLVVMEAMKMENEIKAKKNAVVKSLNVKEGDILDSGHLLLELEE